MSWLGVLSEGIGLVRDIARLGKRVEPELQRIRQDWRQRVRAELEEELYRHTEDRRDTWSSPPPDLGGGW